MGCKNCLNKYINNIKLSIREPSARLSIWQLQKSIYFANSAQKKVLERELKNFRRTNIKPDWQKIAEMINAKN